MALFAKLFPGAFMAVVLALVVMPATAAENLAGEGSQNSPVAEGRNMVMGSFSFSSAGGNYFEDEEDNRTQEWTVHPGGGHFISDGLLLGFHMEGRWFAQGDFTRVSYAVGPVLEYYWDNSEAGAVQGELLPYMGLGYLWGQDRDESPAGKTKYNSGQASLTAGLSWLLSNQVATDISINYRFGHYFEKVPEEGNGIKANRWGLMLGFKAFLP